MNPETVLQIILTAELIVLEVIKGIPIDERQKMWLDHQVRVKFWIDLFEKLTQK
jgi:hypothetical protein